MKVSTFNAVVCGFAIVLVSAIAANTVKAAPPELQTPAPVIYLADNLDEADKLGWCIDTLGRGFSDRLQAHSCKPYGGDVQFRYDAKNRQIQSVEFAGKCAEIIDAASRTVAFGLLDCDTANAKQKFDYFPETGFFKPAGQGKLCIAAGAASRSAGPFMSRALVLADCAATEAKLIKWVVK